MVRRVSELHVQPAAHGASSVALGSDPVRRLTIGDRSAGRASQTWAPADTAWATCLTSPAPPPPPAPTCDLPPTRRSAGPGPSSGVGLGSDPQPHRGSGLLMFPLEPGVSSVPSGRAHFSVVTDPETTQVTGLARAARDRVFVVMDAGSDLQDEGRPGRPRGPRPQARLTPLGREVWPRTAVCGVWNKTPSVVPETANGRLLSDLTRARDLSLCLLLPQPPSSTAPAQPFSAPAPSHTPALRLHVSSEEGPSLAYRVPD